MPKDSSHPPPSALASEKPARRRRSFGRMSDQEMRAVFESLEPRSSLLGCRRWIRVVVAVVIVACLFVLLVLRTAVHFERTSGGVLSTNTEATGNSMPVPHRQAGESPHGSWEASEDSGTAIPAGPAGNVLRD